MTKRGQFKERGVWLDQEQVIERAIKSSLSSLPKDMQEVIKQRRGIEPYSGKMTFANVAKFRTNKRTGKVGVSPGRARQIYNQAIRKLIIEYGRSRREQNNELD